MSKILDLKTKYHNYDSRSMNNHQKTDLREALRAFSVGDLASVDEHKMYVELLKLFRTSLAEDDKLKGDNYPALLESLLSVGEDGVYSTPLRFLFELIQNVDDCDYADHSRVELDVQTDYNNGKIVLTYNETGFTPFNVFAITGIAEAAKNVSSDKVEIGEKGIGFKSVFGVADKVLIQSGKFSFELYKNNFTIPEPAYENFEEVSGTRLTLFVEPMKVKGIYDEFVRKYHNKESLFNQNPLLFLNKLTKLHLYFDCNRSLTFNVSRSAPLNGSELQIETDVHVSVDLRDYHKENGLPIYQTILASTQKELTSKLNSYRESFKGVNLTENSRMSLGAWLDKWLDEYMAMTLRPSTLKGYRHIINDYIKPHLGGKQIYAVTTADVQKMYNALKKNGRLRADADGEKGLSGSTVRSVHMVLHEAMEYALREHLIVKNPTENTVIPKASGAVMNILNDEQLDRFMEAIKQEPLWHDLFYTAITTGLRRGELCGLMWTDFDGEKGTLKINRTLTSDGARLYVGDTKTVSGEREILLPSSTAELLKKRKEERRSKWIFPRFIKTEEPISPALAYSTLKRILKKAGLPGIRFHDLRHTFATHAIASGVDAKTLSGILGHTNASFTLDRYTHVTTEMQRNAANIMGGVIENIIGEID